MHSYSSDDTRHKWLDNWTEAIYALPVVVLRTCYTSKPQMQWLNTKNATVSLITVIFFQVVLNFIKTCNCSIFFLQLSTSILSWEIWPRIFCENQKRTHSNNTFLMEQDVISIQIMCTSESLSEYLPIGANVLLVLLQQKDSHLLYYNWFLGLISVKIMPCGGNNT